MVDKWITRLPLITELLPVCNKGTEIGLIYYVCSNFGDTAITANYAMESIYAYRQLIRNTNFPAYGRVAFFLDKNAADVLTPIYESVGLLSLVRWVDVGEYQHMAGYFKCFSDEYFQDCRYVFQSDTDMWFFRFNLNQPLFDWGAFIQELDTADEMAIYGFETTKGSTSTDFFYRYDSVLASPVRAALGELFDVDIGAKEHWLPYDARWLTGIFTAVRNDSAAFAKLRNFTEKYIDVFQDDMGAWSVFLTSETDIKVHDFFDSNQLFWKGTAYIRETAYAPPECLLFHAGCPQCNNENYSEHQDVVSRLEPLLR